MPKKGHTEEQIVAVLRQVKAGARVAEICRKVGISPATYYLWKRQYSGVGVSEPRELRQPANCTCHSGRRKQCDSAVYHRGRPSTRSTLQPAAAPLLRAPER